MFGCIAVQIQKKKVTVQLMRMLTVPRPRGSEPNVACRPGVFPKVVITTPPVLGAIVVVSFPVGAASVWAARNPRIVQVKECSISAESVAASSSRVVPKVND